MATAKATVVAAKLASELQVRLPTLTVTTSTSNTSGKPPLINITAQAVWASGDSRFVIRIKSLDLDGNSTNIFGDPQVNYANHVIELAVEAGAVAGTAKTPLASLMQVTLELLRQGIVTKIYHGATGVEPAETDMVDANLNTTLHPNLWWPTQIGQ